LYGQVRRGAVGLAGGQAAIDASAQPGARSRSQTSSGPSARRGRERTPGARHRPGQLQGHEWPADARGLAVPDAHGDAASITQTLVQFGAESHAHAPWMERAGTRPIDHSTFLTRRDASGHGAPFGERSGESSSLRLRAVEHPEAFGLVGCRNRRPLTSGHPTRRTEKPSLRNPPRRVHRVE
jgi:hypothetical protein